MKKNTKVNKKFESKGPGSIYIGSTGKCFRIYMPINNTLISISKKKLSTHILELIGKLC